MKRQVVSAILATVVAGCGGGGNGTVPASGSNSTSTMATVSAKLVVPGGSASTAPKLRRIYSQAASTQGISFIVFPHGTSSASAIVTTAVDISATASSVCVTSGTGRTCTVSFQAPAVSTNDILVQTWDQKPVSGVIPGSAHVLSAQTLPNVPITSGTTNTVSLTLNPVVASLNISTTPKTLHTLFPASFAISVVALDNDQNVILAGTYADTNGNPVTLNLTPSDPSVSISPSSVGASGTVVIGTYNGTAYAPANGSKTVTITESGNFGGSFSISILGATVTSYALHHAIAPSNSTYYYGAAYVNVANNDPQIWVVDTDTSLSYNGGIDRYDVAAHTVTYTAGYGGYPLQGGIAVASNITPNATVYTGGQTFTYDWPYAPTLGTLTNTSCSIGTGGSCSPITSNVLYDGSLNLYWVSGNRLQVYSTSMSITSGITAASLPTTIAGMDRDSSGNVFMADAGTGNNLWGYIGSSLSSITNGNPLFDVKGYGGVEWFTYNTPSTTIGGATASPFTFGPYLSLAHGQARYLYNDASSPGALYADEQDTAGNISIMRYDGTHVAEAPLGVTGTAEGPVSGLPDGSKIYVVNFNSAGGTLYEVTP